MRAVFSAGRSIFALQREAVFSQTRSCYSSEGKEQGKALQSEGFPDKRIVYVESKGKPEVEIEDLFTDDDFLQLINQYYSDRLRHHKSFRQLKKEDLRQAREKAGPLKLTKILGAIFAENGWGTFDKDGVCDWFCRRAIGDNEIARSITLERFEGLFQSLHSALESLKSPEPAERNTTMVASGRT